MFQEGDRAYHRLDAPVGSEAILEVGGGGQVCGRQKGIQFSRQQYDDAVATEVPLISFVVLVDTGVGGDGHVLGGSDLHPCGTKNRHRGENGCCQQEPQPAPFDKGGQDSCHPPHEVAPLPALRSEGDGRPSTFLSPPPPPVRLLLPSPAGTSQRPVPQRQ